MSAGQTLIKRAVLVTFLLTLPTGLSSALAQPVGNIKLDETEWVLESLNGKLLSLETPVTLEFRKRALGGWDGCNYYGGPYRAGPTSFEIVNPGIVSTMMGCGNGAVPKQSSRYGSLLYETVNYRVKGNHLEFLSDAGKVTLQFAKKVELPMNPAELSGTRWRLRTFESKDLPSNILVTLEFPKAESFKVVAGCLNYTREYIAEGNDIRFTEGNYDYTRCDEELEDVYPLSVSVITDYQLKGDTLELLTDKGETYLFIAP